MNKKTQQIGKHYDLVIIGGGISGCAIAADAAGRGLKVLLCEKNSLGSATSSASTKLIHGGLRYLEQYRFKMVREALKESEILIKRCPYLITPLSLIMPYSPSMRPKWLIRLGLWFYDHLYHRDILKSSKTIHNMTEFLLKNPLKSNYQSGFYYQDGYTDDSRLVIANALLAKKLGATICPHSKITQQKSHNNIWHLDIESQNTVHSIQTKAIINATGPWVSHLLINTFDLQPNFNIKWIKGSHIVVPKLFEGDRGFILQNDDKRVIFALPYHGHTMIGTTDMDYNGNLNKIKINQKESSYLCKASNRYFKTQITASDIIDHWSGVRTVLANPKQSNTELSRDYHLSLCNKPAPILSIIGGKLTAHRQLAEQAINQLKSIFPKMGSSHTKYQVLPGGETPYHYWKDYRKDIINQYSNLPKALINRWLDNYGTRLNFIIHRAKTTKDLGIDFGHRLYQAEVDYLIQHEWASNVDDILWRLSKLGLTFDQKQKQTLAQYISQQTQR